METAVTHDTDVVPRCTKCAGLFILEDVYDTDAGKRRRFLKCANCCSIIFEEPGVAGAVKHKLRIRRYRSYAHESTQGVE